MAGNDRSESKTEGASESGKNMTRTSAHVTNESVTEEPQAQRYEPKFKSYSGTQDGKLHTIGNDMV